MTTHTRPTPLLALYVAFAACGTNTEQKASPPGDPHDQSEDSGAFNDSPPTGSVTYYSDVQPILEQYCVRCHQEGGLGPGDFTDPDVVNALAPAIIGAIDGGRMPPPVSDPDCQDYTGSEHLRLPDASRDVIAAWIDAGQPLGDPSDAAPPVVIDTELPDPDHVLTMPEPYAPTFADAENPGNEYRCFALDPGVASGKYITALAPIVDQAALVHHVVLFSVPEAMLDAEELDPQGFDCIDAMGDLGQNGMIAAWAPGMLPLEMPDGMGLRVQPGHRLVMQMHYFANGNPGGTVYDQSAYAFELADSASPVIVQAVGTTSFSIPAGASAHTDGGTLRNPGQDLRLVGVFPHMHGLGTNFEMHIAHEDGSETCLVQGSYNFNNQLTYQWPEPIDFRPGDALEYSCTWDNSAGDTSVQYGERTDEEMCYFFTIVGP